jgi:hypothetical protein
MCALGLGHGRGEGLGKALAARIRQTGNYPMGECFDPTPSYHNLGAHPFI